MFSITNQKVVLLTKSTQKTISETFKLCIIKKVNYLVTFKGDFGIKEPKMTAVRALTRTRLN